MGACVLMAHPRFPVRIRQRFDYTSPDASVKATLLSKGVSFQFLVNVHGIFCSKLTDWCSVEGAVYFGRANLCPSHSSCLTLSSPPFPQRSLTLGMCLPLTAVDIKITDS